MTTQNAKNRADALLEIGCEEIPVDYISRQYLENLRVNVEDIFREALLDFTYLTIKATCRRVSFFLHELSPRQKDEPRSSAPRKILIDPQGQLTKAGESFLKKWNISPLELKYAGPNETAEFNVPGKRTEEILSQAFLKIFSEFEFPKTMRWESGQVRFARPIRWIVALYGKEVIPVSFAGLESGRMTQLHPLHKSQHQSIDQVEHYESLLEKGYVLLDSEKRQTQIKEMINQACQKCGGRWVQDQKLLEMVNMMAEWPGVITGAISQDYMSMPREIITTSMREHQRFFAVESQAGKLMPHFIAVYDNPCTDGAKILPGNERVLAARLKDALFFYREDVKHPLGELVPELKRVLWIKGLGNLWDKTQRLEALAGWLGEKLESAAKSTAIAAAHLAKADLISNMVQEKEYTALQGTMGGIYAKAQGLAEDLGQAIGEQYLPRWANDGLPQTPAGKILALADKMDHIIGCWGAGFIPTGAKDPYALRRAAQGIISITLDAGYRYALTDALQQSLKNFESFRGAGDKIISEVKKFFENRIETELANRSIPPDLIQAVLGVWWDDLTAVVQKASAIQTLRSLPGFNEAVVSFSRVVNILPKNTPRQIPPSEPDLPMEVQKFGDGAEKKLYAVYLKIGPTIKELSQQGDFQAAFKTLGELKNHVDAFFDQVMVMDEDLDIRRNRLNLLANVARNIWRIADFSKIVIAG